MVVSTAPLKILELKNTNGFFPFNPEFQPVIIIYRKRVS